MPESPEPTRKPPRAKPSPPPAAPKPPSVGKTPAGATPVDATPAGQAQPAVRPIAKPPLPRAKRATPDPVPVGKLVTPASVAPPPPAPASAPRFDAPSFSAGAAGHSGAFRARRRGTPVAVWGVVGLGVAAVGVLIAVLVMRPGDESTADGSPDKGAAAKQAKSDSGKSDDAKPSSTDGAGATRASPKATDADDKPEVTPVEPPREKPVEKPVEKPQAQPDTPVAPPRTAVKQFRGIEEVPVGERSAALENVITDSVALLEAGKFEEFFNAHVDPRDRGATPPAVGTRRRNDSPYDVLAQGTEKIGQILAGIGDRQPHLLEDDKIAVFDLGWRTRPTFVEHEGKWYLSRGRATRMDDRFEHLTDQEEILYLLEVTSGQPAVAPADAQREGTEQGVIEQLTEMGAIIALTHPDEEYRRSAVMITRKFKGGDEGLALLGQLSDRSQMVALVVDGMSGSNITEEVGLMEFDGLEYLEYLRFVNTPVTRHPVTVHFAEMSRLKTLIFDGGDQVSDAQINDHLRTAADLQRFSIQGDRITDSTLEYIQSRFPGLTSLELNVPQGAVTPGAVANLRKALPGLWVDF